MPAHPRKSISNPHRLFISKNPYTLQARRAKRLIPKRKLIPRKRVKLAKPVRIRFKKDRKNFPDVLYKIPTKTLMITTYAIRWILFFILVYVIISVGIMFFTQSYQFLQQVVTLSLGGFFGFFMGYFGWLFADHLVKWLKGKRKGKELSRDLDLL